MSESTRGDGEQRAWWAPDDRDAPPVEPAASGSHPAGPGGDEHDPYRTQEVPQAPQAAQGSWSADPAHREWEERARREWGPDALQDRQQDPQRAQQQSGAQPAADPRPDPYGQQDQYGGQYGGQYGQAGQYAAPYGGQPGAPYAPAASYGYGTPVAGQAQAVQWTGIGSLVLLFVSMGTLGFVAAIVALAMAPGARRQVLESHGRLQGLGAIKAGKICAWITLGLTLLAVVGVVLFFVLIGNLADAATFDADDWGTRTTSSR